MKEVELVIKIPEEEYKKISNSNPSYADDFSIYYAIKNGTSLPKHGDLIDKGKFKKWIETQDGDKLMTEYYLDALNAQETIVGGSHDGDID